MKKLSIEEKAEAYDEALKRAKILYNDKNEIGYANAESVLEEVFPLLKESEDEVIRKEIISFIQDDINEINFMASGDYDERDSEDIKHEEWCKKALAWLENIPYTIDHEKREGFHLGYKAALEKQGEQASAWSEKDEKEYKYVLKFVDSILNNCGNKKDYEHCKRCYDWLKSLKQKIGGKQ